MATILVTRRANADWMFVWRIKWYTYIWALIKQSMCGIPFPGQSLVHKCHSIFVHVHCPNLIAYAYRRWPIESKCGNQRLVINCRRSGRYAKQISNFGAILTWYWTRSNVRILGIIDFIFSHRDPDRRFSLVSCQSLATAFTGLVFAFITLEQLRLSAKRNGSIFSF